MRGCKPKYRRLTFLRRRTLDIQELVSAIPVPIQLVIGDNGVVFP